MENVKIDLFDLIRRILHQWKFILITMLVCGLVFEGIGYARAYMSYRQELQATESEDEEEDRTKEYLQDMEDAKADLTDQEITEVETAAAAYQSYMKQYEEELLYCQNSIKMQLDSNHVPTLIMHYAISSSGGNQQVVDRVSAAALELTKDEETCEEIRKALEWETELGYIDDLIGVETSDTLSTSEDADLEINNAKQVQITILAPTKEDCQTIAGIIQSHLAKETEDLQETVGTFEMSLMSETYVEKADNDLRSYQDSKLSSLNTIRNAINTLSSNMTDDQKEYYNALIAYDMASENAEDLTDLAEELEEEEEPAAVSRPGILRWKFILLGLFLGLVLACGYILLRYLLAPNLRIKDDLEDAFHVPMLGYFPAGGKKQRFTREERIEMICAGIRIAVQKADLHNVYITGTAGDGESEKVMEQMQEALADCGAQVSSGRDVACDPASLEQMTASDGVVFVERVDRSPYADIQKEVELCQMYNVPVIGSVVIE